MARYSSSMIIGLVVGLLVGCSMISHARAGCYVQFPIVGPLPKFKFHLKAVFDLLEERTPLQVAKGGRFDAWSPPDGKPGAIMGSATCYGLDPVFCKKCIVDVAGFLSDCRSGAGYLALEMYCEVFFWTVR